MMNRARRGLRSAYDTLGVGAYLRLVDAHKREPFDFRLAKARRVERMPREALEALSFAKLQEIVRYAESSTGFYRDLFARHGVRADELKAPQDFSAWPVLDKNQVFEGYEEMRGAEPRGKVFEARTSGSTGIALQFLTDSEHAAWVQACLWRGRAWWGARRGERELILWGRPLDDRSGSDWSSEKKYRLRNQRQFNTFEAFDADVLDRILDAVQEFQPRIVYGYGSSLGQLARHMLARGVRARRAPRFVEYTADHMLPEEQSIAEEVFGCPVLSQYGSSEAGGLAQQCKEGNLHISRDHLNVEFLRADGSAADEGEQADIVVTTLNNRAMPLIRYRVGDIGAWKAGQCGCGITLPMMSLELGKAVELISTSQKVRVSAHVFDYANIYLMREGIHGIKQYYVEQLALDRFRLSIVPDREDYAEAQKVFVRHMKEHLGDRIEVEVARIEHVPMLASGKRRYFDKRF